MPELPEVENVVRNLNDKIPLPTNIKNWIFWRKNLRYDLPISQLRKLTAQKLLKIERRAKYIVFEFERDIVLSHLGMTGQWRFHQGSVAPNLALQKHDHVAFCYGGDHWLIYQDPRRFGYIELIKKHNILNYFEKYGLEPFDLNQYKQELIKTFRKLKTPIKAALMNQKYIVGVGNIYAAEALYMAGIRPQRSCHSLTAKDYDRLFLATEKVIEQAIEMGGSTILNYRNSNNEEGGFQKKHFVYGKEGQLCVKCHDRIKNIVITGRASCYCPTCQK